MGPGEGGRKVEVSDHPKVLGIADVENDDVSAEEIGQIGAIP